MELPGVSVSVEEIEGRVSKFDLTLSLQERLGVGGEASRLVGGLEYARSMFDEETAHQFVVRFERVLASAVVSPELPLHRLEVLSFQERRQVLAGFNATGRAVPETTLVERFESQVSQRPEATAVMLEEATLSYGELNGRANKLAHYLIALGV